MPPLEVSVSDRVDTAVVEAGRLRIEIAMQPFAFTIRRAGRRMLRAGGAWVADGQADDRFIQFTEGVVANELRSPPQRALRAIALELSFEIVDHERISLSLAATGAPLRLGLDPDRRSEERLVGLGVRHHTGLDQAGRDIQLGADRRYTGPDCPPEMLSEGGIPQGDCAPVP